MIDSPSLSSPSSRLHLPHPVNDALRLVIEDSIEKNLIIPAGEEIFHAMSPYKYLYIIQRGVVKISMLLIDGREQVTGFYIAGEMFGFDGMAQSVHQCEALALTEAEFALLPTLAINASNGHAPPSQEKNKRLLDGFIMNIMSREIRRDQRTIALLGALSAEEKIIAFLLNLSYRQMLRHQPAETLEMPMSRADIGNYLGITSETVSRSLTKLQRDRLINIDGREIVLLERKRLMERVGPSFS